jgi:NADPH:quinone reductase-like Zn-dependent oxidoreductase
MLPDCLHWRYRIDAVYPFEQAVQAYEHLIRGPFGKVVIKIAD